MYVDSKQRTEYSNLHKDEGDNEDNAFKDNDDDARNDTKDINDNDDDDIENEDDDESQSGKCKSRTEQWWAATQSHDYLGTTLMMIILILRMKISKDQDQISSAIQEQSLRISELEEKWVTMRAGVMIFWVAQRNLQSQPKRADDDNDDENYDDYNDDDDYNDHDLLSCVEKPTEPAAACR